MSQSSTHSTMIGRFGAFVQAQQYGVLIALLAVLHMSILSGVSVLGLAFWVVGVGLFILWQPFVQGERQMDGSRLGVLASALVLGAWLFGWGLLLIWAVLLAALLGGRVFLLAHRATRIFYLLAFAYLLAAILFELVPKLVPHKDMLGLSFDTAFDWGAPIIFVLMAFIPRAKVQSDQAKEGVNVGDAGAVDFLYSLFVLLLISVLVLGSLAFMLLRQSLYFEALFQSLLLMAAMLLLIAWAWNPRPGFSGFGIIFSRYVLTISLPFETWLQRLMLCAEGEADPEQFLQRLSESFLTLPWVVGGRWQIESRGVLEPAGETLFGQNSAHCHVFKNEPLCLSLYTHEKLSPSLIWPFHLLSQLANEYYSAKLHARELQQMSYLRAVHETGARLTHDVKNLLQSLNNLCFLAQEAQAKESLLGRRSDELEPGRESTQAPGRESARVSMLLQKQLPQIAQRLAQTLEKLNAPEMPETKKNAQVFACIWWDLLQQRYVQNGIVFEPVQLLGAVSVPAPLFDSVADNLLQNALLKRQSTAAVNVNGGELQISVALSESADYLRVSDNGQAIDVTLARQLLRAPVASDNGLGIGLYHAAQQAKNYAYALHLVKNETGDVCFELRRAEAF